MYRPLLALVVVVLASAPASACWMALDPVGYAHGCPVIIRGVIVDIVEPKEAGKGEERVDDLALIRVDEIIRNDFSDVPLKVGETFAVRMVSRKNRLRASTDLHYHIKTEAIWLIPLKKEGEFRIDWHPVQKQALADRAKLKLDQCGLAKAVRVGGGDERPTQAEWFAKQKADEEAAKKHAEEAEAARQRVYEIAKGLALAPKLDADALRAFREAESGIRLDVFQPAAWRKQPNPALEGDRLVELAEYVLKNDPDEGVRGWAMLRLGRTHREGEPVGKRAIDVLAAGLADPSSRVREYACSSLQERGAKEHTAAIAKLLRDPGVNTRLAAISALGAFGHKESVPAILAAYEGEGKKVPWQAHVYIEALAQLGETRVMLYIAREALKDKDSSDIQRQLVYESLAFSTSREAVPVLMEYLVTELHCAVKHLPEEPWYRTYKDLCQQLEKRTGQKFGTDALAWLDWWNKARVDYGAEALKVDQTAAKAAYERYRELLEDRKK
jgi:HEAT repeat protein